MLFSVCAVIQRRGKFLAVLSSKRGKRPVLPGGHIEPGEIDSEAVMRELREETGVDLSVLLESNPRLEIDDRFTVNHIGRPQCPEVYAGAEFFNAPPTGIEAVTALAVA